MADLQNTRKNMRVKNLHEHTALPKGWLPQLVFSDTRAYLWYLVLLSVLRKDIDRWTSKGRRMVIYELGRTATGKKRRVEEKEDYYERLVNMVASSELHRC